MLDLKFIEANLDAVRHNNADRGVDVDVGRLATLAATRRDLMTEIEDLRARQNKLAQDRGAPELAELKAADARDLKETERLLRVRLAGEIEPPLQDLLARVPNMTHPDVPRGGEGASNVLQAPQGPLPGRSARGDHLDIMTAAGLLDMTAGTKVAGNGFYFLRGDAVLLELALVRYAADLARDNGFELSTVPEVARDEIMAGTGFAPRGAETNTYRIDGEKLSLIATSEIPLCGQFQDSVIEKLPVRVCGISHCYRTERAAGRATRGIYRVHQFTKVEMVTVCGPDQSEAEHLRMLDIEKDLFDGLEIPYRVLDIASGDLGASAYRKYDLEAWMPGRGKDGEFGEVTSTSNCLDYQARRLGIKFRGPDRKTAFAHTLNGTVVATTRAMIALVENHLDGDRVRIPKKLVPYFGREFMPL